MKTTPHLAMRRERSKAGRVRTADCVPTRPRNGAYSASSLPLLRGETPSGRRSAVTLQPRRLRFAIGSRDTAGAAFDILRSLHPEYRRLGSRSARQSQVTLSAQDSCEDDCHYCTGPETD